MNDTQRFEVAPIGVVHGPFLAQAGTPPQPALAGEDAVGTIEILPGYADGLDDLDGFERIWVLSWLDRSGPVRLHVVPYHETAERGLFATRAPSRPNPIGLSALRLLRREGPLLRVADLDLLDGTPVLDIKPYSPRFDVFPDARSGWITPERIRPERPADGRFGPGR